MTVVRPYHGGTAAGINQTPLVYGFDTGFAAWAQGLHEIASKDRGFFWEQLVLNEMLAHRDDSDVMTWRDRKGCEVDFIHAARGRDPVAIEAKWNSDALETNGIRAFRNLHPAGLNIVIAADVAEPFDRGKNGVMVKYCPLSRLPEFLDR